MNDIRKSYWALSIISGWYVIYANHIEKKFPGFVLFCFVLSAKTAVDKIWSWLLCSVDG